MTRHSTPFSSAMILADLTSSLETDKNAHIKESDEDFDGFIFLNESTCKTLYIPLDTVENKAMTGMAIKKT